EHAAAPAPDCARRGERTRRPERSRRYRPGRPVTRVLQRDVQRGELVAQPVRLGEVAPLACLLAQVDQRFHASLELGIDGGLGAPGAAPPCRGPRRTGGRPPSSPAPATKAPAPAPCSRAAWSARSRSKSTARACGVLKSSSITAMKRPTCAST